MLLFLKRRFLKKKSKWIISFLDDKNNIVKQIVIRTNNDKEVEKLAMEKLIKERKLKSFLIDKF